MVENEISILRRVKHRNIVELIEEYETPKEIFLVMELVKVSLGKNNTLKCCSIKQYLCSN